MDDECADWYGSKAGKGRFDDYDSRLEVFLVDPGGLIRYLGGDEREEFPLEVSTEAIA